MTRLFKGGRTLQRPPQGALRSQHTRKRKLGASGQLMISLDRWPQLAPARVQVCMGGVSR